MGGNGENMRGASLQQQGEGHAVGGARRVLVVDDDLCIRKGLRIRLEGAGYEVATAGNGTEAIMIFDETVPTSSSSM